MFSTILPTALLTLLISSMQTTAAPDANKLATCLKAAGVSYLTPSSGSAWTSAKAAFNTRLSFTPISIAKPTSAQQVSAAVKCGDQAQFYTNPRGGHHSYTSSGLGGEDNHFVIDLTAINSVQVNGQIASIGGGARLGDVGLALSAQGRAIATGVCPYVGVGGHGAYGGFGFFSRNWGMVVDQVNSLEVVTYDGQIRTVSASGADSDLFWALRGAAGSFGIITKFNLNTQPAPANVVYATYGFNDLSASNAAKILSVFQSYGINSAPKELGTTLNIFKGSKANTITISLTITYVGSQSDFLNTVIPPFTSKLPVTPSTKKVTSQSWKDTLQLLAGNQNLNTSTANDYDDKFYAKSVMTPQAQPMTDGALQAWTNYIANQGYRSTASNWFLQVELYGGANSAINSVSRTATAFVHRSSLFTLQLYASDYKSPFPQSTIDLVDGFQSSLVNAMGSGWKYEAYQNYIDPSLSASVGHALYYGENYSRLQGIKKTYDPRNVFKVKPDALAIQSA